MKADRPSRAGTALAYAISTTATFLWFGAVLPAGTLALDLPDDLAAPMHREAWLLVPALLLLVIAPVGVVLSQNRVGRLAVLAGTDAFLSGYSGSVLWARGTIRGDVSLLLVAMLLVLCLLSLCETVRVLRLGEEAAPLFKGLRLALCLLALLTPSWLLVRDGRELASLLAPFLLVGVSAAGARLARAPLGLRRTASLVHALLALHVVVTIRYTLFEAEPAFVFVDPIGWSTFALALLVLLLAVLQALWLSSRQRRAGTALALEGGAAAVPP